LSYETEIVEKNLGLVRLCANKFVGRGIEYDDIFQSGCVGLVKAVSGFDSSRGTKFSTYAIPVIFGEIKQLFRETGQVKVSRSIKDLELKLRHERENFAKDHKREPTINELSEILGVSKEDIAEAIAASKPIYSLNSVDENNKPKFEVSENFNDDEISDRIVIHGILSKLEGKDKKLIYLRYFKSKTQSDSAKILGMTQVQVSRREKVILKFLRNKLA
jgi:RNA polymerase sporulation-specific sigma factor